MKLIFLGLDQQRVLPLLKSGLNVVDVFLLGTGENEDAVQLDKSILVLHVSEYINHSLVSSQ